MKTLKVKFDDYEKQAIEWQIECTAKDEPRCRLEKGYSFSITKEQLLFIKDMTLDIVVIIRDYGDESLPPEPENIVERFISFNYKLVEDGDEVDSNLDANFEDTVIKSLDV